jgi:hypothetical protein
MSYWLFQLHCASGIVELLWQIGPSLIYISVEASVLEEQLTLVLRAHETGISSVVISSYIPV